MVVGFVLWLYVLYYGCMFCIMVVLWLYVLCNGCIMFIRFVLWLYVLYYGCIMTIMVVRFVLLYYGCMFYIMVLSWLYVLYYGCMFCGLLFNLINSVFLLLSVYVLIVTNVPFCFIVSFCVLFVCKCVLYYCHRVSTQLQLTNMSYKPFCKQ
jgi:hypothetical protein